MDSEEDEFEKLIGHIEGSKGAGAVAEVKNESNNK